MVTLFGCGSDTPTAVETTEAIQQYTITGFAVKGPLANATVNAYRLDNTKDNLKGALIRTGTTDITARISDFTIPTNTPTPFILEVLANEETIDLGSGGSPVIKTLRTIVTADTLVKGIPLYVTPLTTLVTDLASLNADLSDVYSGDDDGAITKQELLAAIDIAKQQALAIFGFGIPLDTNIFQSAPLVTNLTTSTEQLYDVLHHRSVIEAFSAIVVKLHESHTANTSGSTKTVDDVFDGLSDDLSDGTIDGLKGDLPISALQNIPDMNDILRLSPELLTVPGTSISVADMEQILMSETRLTNVTADSFGYSNKAITVSLVASTGLIDVDRDGLTDASDNCPTVFNPNQLDTDRDEQGNSCDEDDDGDGVLDTVDAFPLDYLETVDTDSDGMGNNADPDDDADGVLDNDDMFPLNASETIDTDGNGVGDFADPDDDGDGVLDLEDDFPKDPLEQLDTDNDGLGNNTDTDDDGDAVLDENDAFPLDTTESVDTDNNGLGNNVDPDDDGDSVLDIVDNCPFVANIDQADSNQDGVGDVCQRGRFGQTTWNSGSQFH